MKIKKKYLNSLIFNEVFGNNENNYKAIIHQKKSNNKLLTEINSNDKNIEISPIKNNESQNNEKEISPSKYKKYCNENNNNDKFHSSFEDESKTKNNLERIKMKIKNIDNIKEN